MEPYSKLIEIFTKPDYSLSYTCAKSTGTCIKCGKQAKAFSDASARLEYSISALCQTCQDEHFRNMKKSQRS